jgi:hypothetical protein
MRYLLLFVLVGCSSLPEPDGWFWEGPWTAAQKQRVSLGAVEGGDCLHAATDQSYPDAIWDDHLYLETAAPGEPLVWGRLRSSATGAELHFDPRVELRHAARAGFEILCPLLTAEAQRGAALSKPAKTSPMQSRLLQEHPLADFAVSAPAGPSRHR